MGERWVKRLMLGTDVGLLAYWTASALGVFTAYRDGVMADWNWSFLGLDLMVSATGLTALWLARRGNPAGRSLMLVSLALTHAAGLSALNFWALRGDYSPGWWAPNLWLALFPVFGVWVLFSRTGRSAWPARTSSRR
ncbi:hypothetical protein Afil01_36100 [Actinorhabdospora filicis]|uniref:Uncharacterized protein n=1 Tax=Actinorhabdospora filicis TaxID=1785913 RepID=A0A9W6WA97_9ACTN|nr:DUF5360 family protein [Actinorhabdospora filicis]GLZ78803.1 hypothetical protein Afil01_36100 [Actinorhabdospora filicis]